MPQLSMSRWLKRAALVLAVSVPLGVWAQAPGQDAKPPASPPPSELEPGVNTSATHSPSQGETPATSTGSETPAPAPASSTRDATSPGSAQEAGTEEGAGHSKAASSARAPSKGAPEKSAPEKSTSEMGAETGRTSGSSKSGAPGKAHDSLQLDATQITGNRELPKVLYIVPWKRSDLGDLVGKPMNSLVDEVLAPVDRDVFKRQNRYYEALKPDAAAQAAPGAAAGPAQKH